MAQLPILIAAATRPHPGETENGDAWQVDWYEGACRIAVIDALGHGVDAAAEAKRARRALADNPSAGAAESLQLCHRALAGGRGAAISVAFIDPELRTVVFAGVGNVEGVLWTPSKEQRLSGDRGIVGFVSRSVHPITIPLEAEWLLVVYTDGVRSAFRLGLLATYGEPVATLASRMLEQWGRLHDDATVLVAAPAAR